MFIYIFNVFLPFGIYVFLKMVIHNRCLLEKVFLNCILFYLIFFLSAFKYQTFTDISTYNRHYEFLATQSIGDFYDIYGYIMEIGYIFFNKILTYINGDPRTLYIARGIVFSLCIIYTIKKHSLNYFISIVFFFLCFGVNQSIFVVRQYLGVAIFLLSIQSVLNKQLCRYILIWLVAFSFHGSLIICLPLYWFYNYWKINKNTILFTSILFMFIAFVIKYLFTVVSQSFGVYEDYLINSDELGTSSGMLVRTLLIFIPFLLFCHRYIVRDGYGKLYFWLVLLNVVMSISLIGIPSGSRLYTNYNAFSILIIPYIYSCLSIRNTRYIYISLSFVIFSFLYFLRLSEYNYYFFWQDCNEYYIPD